MDIRGIRVTGIPDGTPVKDIKEYFENSQNGGTKIKELYYPLQNNDAVLIFDGDEYKELFARRHEFEETEITIKPLPPPVFSKTTTYMTSEITQLVDENPSVMNGLQLDNELEVVFDANDMTYRVSGDPYLIEWATTYLTAEWKNRKYKTNMDGDNKMRQDNKANVFHEATHSESESTGSDSDDNSFSFSNRHVDKIKTSSIVQSQKHSRLLSNDAPLIFSQSSIFPSVNKNETDVAQHSGSKKSSSYLSKSLMYPTSNTVVESQSRRDIKDTPLNLSNCAFSEEQGVISRPGRPRDDSVTVSSELNTQNQWRQTKTIDHHVDALRSQSKSPDSWTVPTKRSTHQWRQPTSTGPKDSLTQPQARYPGPSLPPLVYPTKTAIPPRVPPFPHCGFRQRLPFFMDEQDTQDDDRDLITRRHGDESNIPPTLSTSSTTDIPYRRNVQTGMTISQSDFPDVALEYEANICQINVKLVMGDILTQKTDAIVSPASTDLANLYGIASVIARNADRKMRNECSDYISKNGSLLIGDVMHTCAGGNLNPTVTYILHAAAPSWREDDAEHSAHLLTCTYLNCFQYANKIWLRSLSSPLISAGYFGAPLDVCVQSFYDALLLHVQTIAPSNHLQQIQLVSNNEDTACASVVVFRSLMDLDENQAREAALERYEVRSKKYEFSSKEFDIKMKENKKKEKQHDKEEQQMCTTTQSSPAVSDSKGNQIFQQNDGKISSAESTDDEDSSVSNEVREEGKIYILEQNSDKKCLIRESEELYQDNVDKDQPISIKTMYEDHREIQNDPSDSKIQNDPSDSKIQNDPSDSDDDQDLAESKDSKQELKPKTDILSDYDVGTMKSEESLGTVSEATLSSEEKDTDGNAKDMSELQEEKKLSLHQDKDHIEVHHTDNTGED